MELSASPLPPPLPSSAQVDALLGVVERVLVAHRAELRAQRVRVVALGQLERLPEGLRAALADAAADVPAERASITLALALSYGARDALARAAAALAAAAARGEIDAAAIDEEALAAALPGARARLAREHWDVDLLIRTAGERRLSNFLLFESSYAELHFDERPFPDFDERAFDEALDEFARRRRRFGALDDAPPSSSTAAREAPPFVQVP